MSACPNGASVSADIERLVGRAPGRPQGTGGLQVVATVHSVTPGSDRPGVERWVADLEITSPSHAEPAYRRVEGGTCREVADATAVIVAIALEPGRPVDAPKSRPTPPPPPPTSLGVTSPPSPARTAPVPASDNTAAPRGWSITALSAVDAAALPAPTVGAQNPWWYGDGQEYPRGLRRDARPASGARGRGLRGKCGSLRRVGRLLPRARRTASWATGVRGLRGGSDNCPRVQVCGTTARASDGGSHRLCALSASPT